MRIVFLVGVAWMLMGCAQQAVVSDSTPPTEASLLRLQQHLVQGDAAQRAGQIEEAMMHFLLAEQLLGTKLESGLAGTASHLPQGMLGDEVLWRIARLHELAGRWPEASEVWATAARRADRRGENLQRLGWARLRSGRPVAARESFAAALLQDPRHVQARLGAALSSEALGEWSLAAQQLEEVLLLDPQLRAAQLARARVALRQGDLQTAKDHLRPLLAEAATAEAYGLLGDVLAQEGDYTTALQAYTRHMPLHEAWARLGRQAMQRQEYSRAVRYFEQATKESPRFIEALQKQRAVAEERQRESMASQP